MSVSAATGCSCGSGCVLQLVGCGIFGAIGLCAVCLSVAAHRSERMQYGGGNVDEHVLTATPLKDRIKDRDAAVAAAAAAMGLPPARRLQRRLRGGRLRRALSGDPAAGGDGHRRRRHADGDHHADGAADADDDPGRRCGGRPVPDHDPGARADGGGSADALISPGHPATYRSRSSNNILRERCRSSTPTALL